MNITDALSAYGVKQKEQNASQQASGIPGSVSAGKAAQTGKSGSVGGAEAALYTEKEDLEQKQTSELYSKNVNAKNEQGQAANGNEATEAEKNQDRLNNVSDRMTEDAG